MQKEPFYPNRPVFTFVQKNASTRDAIKYMRKRVYEALHAPDFVSWAKRKFYHADEKERAIFDFVFENIYFYPDPTHTNFVRSAQATIRDRLANCVDYSVLIASILKANGIACKIRAIAPEQIGQYKHVYIITEHGTILDPVVGQRQDGSEKANRKPGAKGHFDKSVPYLSKLEIKV